MIFYVYKAKDSSNEIIEGKIEAETEEEALKKVEEMGYSLINLFEERRIYPRLGSSVNVRYRLIKDKEEIDEKNMHLEKMSITKNISAGGIAFTVSEDVTIDTLIDLEIDLPDGGDLIRCLGKVAWIKKLASSFFEAGICFLDISSPDRTRVNLYVTREENP